MGILRTIQRNSNQQKSLFIGLYSIWVFLYICKLKTVCNKYATRMQQYSHLKFSYMQQTIIYQPNSRPALGTSRLNRNGLYLSICISPYLFNRKQDNFKDKHAYFVRPWHCLLDFLFYSSWRYTKWIKKNHIIDMVHEILV